MTQGNPYDVVSDEAYQYSRSLRGVPKDSHRTVRATRSSWLRGFNMTRTVGTALDDDGQPVLTPEGRGTVKVTNLYSDDVNYVPVSSFKHGRKLRPSIRKAATAHMAQRARISSKDLPAVQNYEQDA